MQARIECAYRGGGECYWAPRGFRLRCHRRWRSARLGQGAVVYQGLTGMHPIMAERWLGNALGWLLKGSGH